MYAKVDELIIYFKYQVGDYQICKIPHIFPDFEKRMDRNMFNMEVLNKYYDWLTKEPLKLFQLKPDHIECFQG